VANVAKECYGSIKRRSMKISQAALEAFNSNQTTPEKKEEQVTAWEVLTEGSTEQTPTSLSKRRSRMFSVFSKKDNADQSPSKGVHQLERVFTEISLNSTKMPVTLGPKAASETKLDQVRLPPLPPKPSTLSVRSRSGSSSPINTPERTLAPSAERLRTHTVTPPTTPTRTTTATRNASVRALVDAMSPSTHAAALRAEQCKMNGILDQLSKILGFSVESVEEAERLLEELTNEESTECLDEEDFEEAY